MPYFCIIVLAAADRCLENLNSYKKKRGTKRKAKEEVSSLFKRSKTTRCAWKHKFVCLAYHDKTRIPTNDVDKDELLQAGLGEKEIMFSDVDISAEEFKDIFYEHYPSLKDGGGFLFFKCTTNTRVLEKLSLTTLSSPAMLKSRVGSARTYIKPIQKDLPLASVVALPDGVSMCTFVGVYF